MPTPPMTTPIEFGNTTNYKHKNVAYLLLTHITEGVGRKE
jgi:hypothetical protein